MAEAKSPVICVTCKRPFPEGLKADDSPRYFAQYGLLPRSDDGENFSYEAQTILRYIRVLSAVLWQDTENMEEWKANDLLELIQQLAEEADRRTELCREALAEVWRRDHGKDAPTQQERGA